LAIDPNIAAQAGFLPRNRFIAKFHSLQTAKRPATSTFFRTPK
jgi:hypothetical protein